MNRLIGRFCTASLVLVVSTACDGGTVTTDPELALDIVAEEAVTEGRGFRGRYNRLVETIRESGNQEALDLLEVALEKQEAARAAWGGESRAEGREAMKQFREALAAAVTTAFPEWTRRMDGDQAPRFRGGHAAERDGAWRRRFDGDQALQRFQGLEELENEEVTELIARARVLMETSQAARQSGDDEALQQHRAALREIMTEIRSELPDDYRPRRRGFRGSN